MAAGTVTLILGGARSGKSRHAQGLAEESGGELVFLATAEGLDAEMSARIARHRQERGARWRTVECPLDLADAIRHEARPGAVLLIDCLTLWVSNLMMAERDPDAAAGDLIAALGVAPCPVILVSNEVGLGIVPDNALARRFRDAAGLLNQRLAAAADAVFLMAAGLALRLK